MPRTFGDGLVHSSHIDVLVEGDEPLGEIPPPSLTPEIHEIAKLIADNLVEDGATIQTGKRGHRNAVVRGSILNHSHIFFLLVIYNVVTWFDCNLQK